jgi:hypothetical protein
MLRGLRSTQPGSLLRVRAIVCQHCDRWAIELGDTVPSAHQHTAPGANVRKFLPGMLLTILSRMSEGDR